MTVNMNMCLVLLVVWGDSFFCCVFPLTGSVPDSLELQTPDQDLCT